jgi:hypothetical protein
MMGRLYLVRRLICRSVSVIVVHESGVWSWLVNVWSLLTVVLQTAYLLLFLVFDVVFLHFVIRVNIEYGIVGIVGITFWIQKISHYKVRNS